MINKNHQIVADFFNEMANKHKVPVENIDISFCENSIFVYYVPIETENKSDKYKQLEEIEL